MGVGRMMATGGAIAKVVAVGAIAAALVDGARADRVVLRGGGQLRGKVLPVEGQPGKVEVLTESGKTPLIFRKDQIAKVEPEPGILDEYLERRTAAPATAEGQHELARWCEQSKLVDLAERHDKRAIELDPEFAPSREALGHVRMGDRWLTRDEHREALGLVKHRGKWITREELERIEGETRAGAEQTAWARQIKILRMAVLTGEPARRLEAEQQLRAIRDPSAVAPLVRALARDPDPVRSLLANILGAIPGGDATRAVVNLLLAEEQQEVREAIVSEVDRRDRDEVLPLLVRSLRSKDPRMVNRAAWALGRLGAIRTVPQLIPALTTVEQRMVWVPTGGGGGGGGIGASFITGGGPSLPILTGPVVAPGAVAFGATSVPLLGAGASSIGIGGGYANDRGPMPMMVPYVHQNVEVRAALNDLTGQDFGFDIPAWKRWVAAHFRAEAQPARRVPQP